MEKELENTLKAIGADLKFIDYILERTYLKDSKVRKVITDKYRKKSAKEREATRKKIKRRLMKNYGDRWKEEWETRKEPDKLNIRKLINELEKEKKLIGKYGEILLEKQKGRPKMKPLHDTICILREYFIELTAKPKWGLIADIINPYYYKGEAFLVASELMCWWKNRQKDYQIEDKGEKTDLSGETIDLNGEKINLNGEVNLLDYKSFMQKEYNFFKQYIEHEKKNNVD
jgi:hypothetical protein